MPKSPKASAVSTDPEVKLEKKVPEEELVSVHVDRDMTDGGIRINGKLFVGTVKVPAGQATDLMRIQEEYFETKKKLFDPSVRVRMKNDDQKRALFLADPKFNESKKTFSRDFGLLPREEWNYCSDVFKEQLLSERMQMFGY